MVGWNATLDVCDWTGVYCTNSSGTGRVFWMCGSSALALYMPCTYVTSVAVSPHFSICRQPHVTGTCGVHRRRPQRSCSSPDVHLVRVLLMLLMSRDLTDWVAAFHMMSRRPKFLGDVTSHLCRDLGCDHCAAQLEGTLVGGGPEYNLTEMRSMCVLELSPSDSP